MSSNGADTGARPSVIGPDGRRNPATKPASSVVRMRIEGTLVELDPMKLDGLEMRIVERMTSLPYGEAADYAERGSSTALLAFIYVALKRSGSDVGEPDAFLSGWTLDRIQAIERIDDEDPTTAPAEGASVDETAVESSDSGSKGSAGSGDPGTLASMESDRGTWTG